jgi:hypothetical protein
LRARPASAAGDAVPRNFLPRKACCRGLLAFLST